MRQARSRVRWIEREEHPMQTVRAAPMQTVRAAPMQTVRAAQYLRMSTERQEYSLDCQSAGIAAYALEHGFEICQTYCDEAKSGLDLARRSGLSQLLRDVVGGQQSYKAILVFDVSRWGRFQDPDEGAHYEFLCRAAGVQVHYCAELFRRLS